MISANQLPIASTSNIHLGNADMLLKEASDYGPTAQQVSQISPVTKQTVSPFLKTQEQF